MRWFMVLAMLTACDRVFGLGDPYQDARAGGIDTSGPNPDGNLDDGTRRIDADSRIPQLLVDFPFDGTMVDSVTTRPATCTGTCTSYSAGHNGNSLAFDGTTCVKFNFALTAVPDPAEVTLALWTKATNGATYTLLSRPRELSTVSPHSWEVEEDSSSLVWDTSTAANGDDFFANLETIDGMWHHIAVTMSATDKTIYLDGNSQATLSPTDGTDYGTGIYLFIGCDGSASAGRYQGLIDDVKIYSGALSAAGINLLANQ